MRCCMVFSTGGGAVSKVDLEVWISEYFGVYVESQQKRHHGGSHSPLLINIEGVNGCMNLTHYLKKTPTYIFCQAHLRVNIIIVNNNNTTSIHAQLKGSLFSLSQVIAFMWLPRRDYIKCIFVFVYN